MDKPKTLQTVDRALSFLEFVAAAREPPHIREVAKALGVNGTTCYHLLRTLVNRGYISRRSDGRLTLGDGIGVLFRNYRQSMGIEESLAEVVRRLSAQTMETTFLSLIEGNNVVLKVLVEGSQRLRVAGLYVGLTGHEYRRAAGKAVLSHLPEPARTEMLEASLTALPERQRNKIRRTLEKELPLSAARGWAVDDGATEEGIIAVGAPIFGASGAVVGAVGMVTPTFRMDRSRQQFMNAVIASAAEANRLLKAAGDARQ